MIFSEVSNCEWYSFWNIKYFEFQMLSCVFPLSELIIFISSKLFLFDWFDPYSVEIHHIICRNWTILTINTEDYRENFQRNTAARSVVKIKLIRIWVNMICHKRNVSTETKTSYQLIWLLYQAYLGFEGSLPNLSAYCR